MTLGTILLIVLVLLLVGAIPSWPHSRGWGYGPSGGLGIVLHCDRTDRSWADLARSNAFQRARNRRVA